MRPRPSATRGSSTGRGHEPFPFRPDPSPRPRALSPRRAPGASSRSREDDRAVGSREARDARPVSTRTPRTSTRDSDLLTASTFSGPTTSDGTFSHASFTARAFPSGSVWRRRLSPSSAGPCSAPRRERSVPVSTGQSCSRPASSRRFRPSSSWRPARRWLPPRPSRRRSSSLSRAGPRSPASSARRRCASPSLPTWRRLVPPAPRAAASSSSTSFPAPSPRRSRPFPTSSAARSSSRRPFRFSVSARLRPSASWGRALADARESLTSAWWCVVPPAVALFLFVLSARKVGEALSESR